MFVGYEDALNAAWIPDQLTPSVRDALDRLIASVPVALASGVRDERALRRAAGDALDAFYLAVDREGRGEVNLAGFVATLFRTLTITQR